MRRYFTDDASVEYPAGAATGAEAIAALIDGTGMAPFQRTHHLSTNLIVDLAGNRAEVRFNLLATHGLAQPPGVRSTVVDSYDGEVVRTVAAGGSAARTCT